MKDRFGPASFLGQPPPSGVAHHAVESIVRHIRIIWCWRVGWAPGLLTGTLVTDLGSARKERNTKRAWPSIAAIRTVFLHQRTAIMKLKSKPSTMSKKTLFPPWRHNLFFYRSHGMSDQWPMFLRVAWRSFLSQGLYSCREWPRRWRRCESDRQRLGT